MKCLHSGLLVVALGLGLLESQSLAAWQSDTAQTTTNGNTPAASPSRLHLFQGAAQKLLRKQAMLHYPDSARSNHVTGIVRLGAVISKTGDVSELKVLSGNPVLAESALGSVKKWKYKPYLLNGEATEFETEIEVHFDLQ